MMTSYNSSSPLVFGILTMPDEHRLFRGNTKNFIDIIRAGEQMGVRVFVITIDDLKPLKPIIKGYEYSAKNKTWHYRSIPLPRIIYNRIPHREDEILPETKATIKTCLKHPGIVLFNPGFFNKWTLFKWLRSSNVTKRYIPSTQRFTSRVSLKTTLKKHPLLYLKPEKGKAGQGIMKVERVSDNVTPYHLNVQDKKTTKLYKYKTTDGLRKKITNLIGDDEYIVQQGISLAKHNNRPFDLRVLVQKNYQGNWTISGIGARVAGTSSITTHVPRGGSIDEPLKLLTYSFGDLAAERIMYRVRKAVIAMTKQIEKSSGQLLGEISMDLGVDESKKIWFFEANSKPMKFDEPEIRRRSLQKLIEYGIYLTNNPKSMYKKRTQKKKVNSLRESR